MEYIIIICIVIIFYIRTIEYSLIVDDIQHYANRKKGHHRWEGEHFKGLPIFYGVDKQGKYRFAHTKIGYLALRLMQRFYGGGTFGLNTITDHALTTGLHALTCCLIYYAFGSNQISFWTAVLYSVNPSTSQTAIWLNGRRYQVVIILILLALSFKPLGFIFYLMTPAFQLTGFFFPILYWNQSPLFLLALPVLIMISYKQIKVRYKSRMNMIYNKDQRTWGWKRVKVVIKSYAWYFSRMLTPSLVCMNYPFLIKWGVTEEGNKQAYKIDFAFFGGLLALFLTGAIISVPELRLYGIFIFLGTLQWCAIICAFQQLTDRYISLMTVFMMYILVYILFTYLPNMAIPIICLIFGAYATQLNITMRMYRSISDFFEYQLFHHPETSRNRIIYADTFLQSHDITRAWLLVRDGLMYDPDDFELLYRGAVCSMSVGQLDKADSFIQKAQQNYYVGQDDFQKSKLDKLKMQIAKIIQKHNMSRKVNRADVTYDKPTNQKP